MNNKFAVLVGIGANSVEIPALVFPEFETGLRYCKEILGEPTRIKENNARWNVDGFEYDAEEHTENQKDHDMISLIVDESETGRIKQKGNKTFSSESFYKFYYGGCGEFYALELKEVEFGKPFVGWDLD